MKLHYGLTILLQMSFASSFTTTTTTTTPVTSSRTPFSAHYDQRTSNKNLHGAFVRPNQRRIEHIRYPIANAATAAEDDATTTTAVVVSIEDISKELEMQKDEFEEKMAAATTVADAEGLRREYLGKKGPVNQVMKYMKDLPNEDKPKLGAVVNAIKTSIEERVVERKEALEVLELEQAMKQEKLDVTMPGLSREPDVGRRHALSMTMEKAVDVFTKLGYDTVTACEDSPEIETDYYCFEALNCPKDHPARDMQDTFYLSEDRERLLRTHTSAVQIRQLEKRKPPLRIVAPGRVYRKDDIDATHSLMFHQVEILALEPRGQLDLGHLKGTVEHFLKAMFGPNIKIRFRGSFFPFTEPSMEVDVFFRGKWLEVLGCGMVDPRVLEMAGIDPEEYSGFAAGFGVERFAMVIHGITDLREFYKNDLRFVQQFPFFYDDGVTSFLGGETMVPEPEDVRGEDVPFPPVESMDELIARNNNVAKENNQEKKKKSKNKKKDAPTADAAPIDVSKLDIRVGVIQKAWEHPDADKLYCEEIDIGEETGPRQIVSGLRAHYTLDELVGQKVLVLANLKSRKLVGIPSHGMVLCAVKEEDQNDVVKFVTPPTDAVVGERIVVDGYDGEPATENQIIKKKMLDIIFPQLSTNDDGIATYNGVPMSTSAGSCTSEISNGSIS